MAYPPEICAFSKKRPVEECNEYRFDEVYFLKHFGMPKDYYMKEMDDFTSAVKNSIGDIREKIINKYDVWGIGYLMLLVCEKIPNPINNILNQMIHPNPLKRWTFTQLLAEFKKTFPRIMLPTPIVEEKVSNKENTVAKTPFIQIQQVKRQEALKTPFIQNTIFDTTSQEALKTLMMLNSLRHIRKLNGSSRKSRSKRRSRKSTSKRSRKSTSKRRSKKSKKRSVRKSRSGLFN